MAANPISSHFQALQRLPTLRMRSGSMSCIEWHSNAPNQGRLLYLAPPQLVVVNRFQNRELWAASFFDDENECVLGYDFEREEITQWLPK
jgi:hypothetical protein